MQMIKQEGKEHVKERQQLQRWETVVVGVEATEEGAEGG